MNASNNEDAPETFTDVMCDLIRAAERERIASHFDLCKNNSFSGPGVAKIIRTNNYGVGME